MMFVSRRILPGIRVDLFASFLDGIRHGVEIGRIDRTREAHEALSRRSGGIGQTASEIQNLALVRSVQAVHLLDNFVFDGLCHNQTDLGKGMFNVKGDLLTPLFRESAGVCRAVARGSHLGLPLAREAPQSH